MTQLPLTIALLVCCYATKCVLAFQVPYSRSFAQHGQLLRMWPSAEQPDDSGEEDDEERDEIAHVFDSIVKIYCTHSDPDYLIPWQNKQQTTSTSSGFIIDTHLGPCIMTNAHSVEHASMIQVQRRGDDRKQFATLEVIGNECDLALLKVESPDFWGTNSNDACLKFGPLPALQDEVEVVGYPMGGDSLSVTSGVVSRIEMQEYAQAGMHLLSMQTDSGINAGNSGGPVLDEDLLVVGVAFQTLDSAENIGYVVPVTVVDHFLQDIQRHSRYTGFCTLGVGLSLLENAAFRKYLGMSDGQSGVMVKDIRPTSPAKKVLRERDVLMAADGIPVANDGKVPFRRGERVSLLCYTQTKFPGDTIRLTLWRDQEEIEVDVPVYIASPLVPAHWDNKSPPYLVVGGLVFTALSAPFLEAAGAWDGYVSDTMSYLLTQVDTAVESDDDQVVVLAQVLAHRANLGYDQWADLQLVKFNDQKVRSLTHLKDLISSTKTDAFVRFEFAHDGRIVVMERSTLDQVTEEVCKEHSIQKPYVSHRVNEGEESSAVSRDDSQQVNGK